MSEHDIARFAYGTPSFEEWQGMWKTQPTDTALSQDEFHAAYIGLGEVLSKLGKVGFHADCDFYVLGDSWGDKTQVIEIVKASALTIELVLNVQDWLRTEFASWRVMIPTNLAPTAMLAVYPEVVRLPREVDGLLDQALGTLRCKMANLK